MGMGEKEKNTSICISFRFWVVESTLRLTLENKCKYIWLHTWKDIYIFFQWDHILA